MGAKTMNKQKQNNCLRTDYRSSHWGTQVNFTAQIFNLDSGVLKHQARIEASKLM